MVSGAIVGGASDSEVERLRQYARDIGLAFQVQGYDRNSCSACLTRESCNAQVLACHQLMHLQSSGSSFIMWTGASRIDLLG